MRHTDALVKVARALCADPRGKHWGYPLTKTTGLRSGALYPILNRMMAEGWLEDGWEDIDPAAARRPPRRYYEITPDGLRELGAVVRRADLEEARGRSRAGRAALA
ncbi:PadR family transcriptional regulator [Microbacterium sp. B19]|uniref:helix-turn-helix transcriptional regulator n=1 Tax=Microbacterium sp. B19 TaxID=96765 RepID=UPI000A0734C0